MTDHGQNDTPTRKKSEARQRQEQVKLRCTKDEFNAIAAKASAAGMTTAAYARATMLGDAGPRAQRRLPADAQLLRQVLGQLGRVGNNLNQIAYHLNADEAIHTQVPELREALHDYNRMREAIYAALGKKPGGETPQGATP